MAFKVPITSGFKTIPEGVHEWFIYDVKSDARKGVVGLYMISKDGHKFTNKFTLKRRGEWSEGAMQAFSWFAKNALNDDTITEIDADALKGHYVCAEIQHTEVESTKNPGQTMTFANIKGEISPCDGFVGQIDPKAKALIEKTIREVVPEPMTDVNEDDLDALLA